MYKRQIYNFIDDESALMSNDPKWMEQWDEGFAFLKGLHPYMYKSGDTVFYPNKNQGTLDLLTQGEIDMCPNWADMVLSPVSYTHLDVYKRQVSGWILRPACCGHSGRGAGLRADRDHQVRRCILHAHR